MSGFDIKFSVFHVVDYEREVAEIPPAVFENQAVVNYIGGIIAVMHNKRNNRAFSFSDSASNICSLTQIYASMLESQFGETALRIATILAKTEKIANDKYGHLNQVRHGGLVQAVYIVDEQLVILLAKVDYNDFLDKTDFAKHAGLPIDRYVLKAFTMTYSFDSVSGEATADPVISVFDTNTTISDYWWNKFLELEELNTDEANTEKSLNAHLQLIGLKLTKNHKSDYTFLRNRVISYFRTNSSYNHDIACSTIYGGYDPSNALCGDAYEQLISSARDLPEKKDFDKQFNVIPDRIKKKMTYRISLRPNIELNITGEVRNLESVVTPYMKEGRKYIAIESDSGYEHFKSNNNS